MEPAQHSVGRSAYFRSRYIRLFAGVIVVLILIIIIGVIGWSVYKSSRSKPMSVDLYPNVQVVVATEKSALGDRSVYATSDSVQQVIEFYSARLPKDDANGCRKLYTDKTPSQEPGHYFGRCIVDNSFGDIIQRLAITINYQTSTKFKTPQTMIEVLRDWGN